MPPNNKPIWAMNTSKKCFSIISMQVCYVSVNVDAALLRMSEFDYDLHKDITYIVLFSESFLLLYSSTFFYNKIRSWQMVHTFSSRLIEMGIDGFSTTVFCYGQTGSGKTHTLTGPPYLVSFHQNSDTCTFCLTKTISLMIAVVDTVYMNIEHAVARWWY